MVSFIPGGASAAFSEPSPCHLRAIFSPLDFHRDANGLWFSRRTDAAGIDVLFFISVEGVFLMPLKDTELRNYDSNVLRLPADKRTEYHGQVDRLINALSKTVKSKTTINITKVVKAGSFAKYTI
jgi:hypothetical protein